MKVRHNLLIEAREQLGLKASEAAKAIGVGYQTLLEYEGLRRYPMGLKDGWMPTAEKIAKFYGYSVGELWPAMMREISTASVERVVDGDKLLAAAGSIMALLPGPGDQLARDDMQRQLDAALSKLTVRERDVIERRAGIGRPGGESEVMDTIAASWGVSHARISQVEKVVLRKLRAECASPAEVEVEVDAVDAG